jgi:hypothetical protein
MQKLIIKNKFGVVPNSILNSNEISLKAKGLYGYLQSKPSGWRFSVSRIASQCKEGKSAIREALKELESVGLLVRKPVRKSNGFWDGYAYILFEKSVVRKSDDGFSDDGFLEYPSNKEYSKKDIVKKNNNTVNNGDKNLLKKLPSLQIPSLKIEYIKDEILKQLKDEHSENFYRLVASKIPEHIIRKTLAEIRQDGAENPARVFSYRMKKYAQNKLTGGS